MKNIEKMVEGNWDKIKNRIKRKWDKLSDEDITQVEGSYDKLAEKIKKSYNLTEEKISDQLGSFLEEAGIKLKNNTKNGDAEEGLNYSNIKNKLEKIVLDSLDNIKNKSIDIEENIVTYVKNNPVKSIAFAVIAGVAFSRIRFNNKKE